MNPPAGPTDDFEAVCRDVAHELYGKLALYSAVVWTLGTVLLFINFAAGNPRPMPMAAMSMLLPLIPAALPWLVYRPLTRLHAERRLRQRATREAEDWTTGR